MVSKIAEMKRHLILTTSDTSAYLVSVLIRPYRKDAAHWPFMLDRISIDCHCGSGRPQRSRASGFHSSGYSTVAHSCLNLSADLRHVSCPPTTIGELKHASLPKRDSKMKALRIQTRIVPLSLVFLTFSFPVLSTLSLYLLRDPTMEEESDIFEHQRQISRAGTLSAEILFFLESR